jgi:hypothetical protein
MADTAEGCLSTTSERGSLVSEENYGDQGSRSGHEQDFTMPTANIPNQNVNPLEIPAF